MRPSFYSLVFAFSIILLATVLPVVQTTAKPPRPTKLARYLISSYISADSTRLRVNINKEIGGQVAVHLVDPKGNVYFEKTMAPADTSIRLSLNLVELNEGDYTLKVSNGLDVIVRDFKIITRKPTKITRTITLL